ncbi:MAG TPA: TetR/AcrR family transcriptional regulator [Acidimicrobiales bacterium]|jgi:AcrR family transcriptional regulator|nr:TetR/AcrR family transcriptional regulator [Acidimicrobiales bacterium]
MAETSVTPAEPARPADGDGRTNRSARTRLAVVDALLSLNEKGNLRPTAREIADEAGVSLRSIYVHFDDVESLLVAAAIRHTEHLQSLALSLLHDGPLEARIDRLLAHRRRIYEAGPGIRRAALLQEPFSPALQRAMDAGRAANRAEIDQVFATEIQSLPEPDGIRLRQALSLVTGPTTWDVMRRHDGLSADEAEEQLRRLVRAVLDAWTGAGEPPDT